MENYLPMLRRWKIGIKRKKESLVSLVLFLLQSSVWVGSQTGGECDMNDIRETHFINKPTLVLSFFYVCLSVSQSDWGELETDKECR